MTFLSTNLVITEKLEKLGLNKKEAQIYLAALESGETNIEGLSKKSKIKRTTVYDIVESLKEKGLLSSTFSKKKKYIFANDPRKINEKLDEQKAIFRKLMPELLSISNLIEKKPRIKIFDPFNDFFFSFRIVRAFSTTNSGMLAFTSLASSIKRGLKP